MGVQKMGESQCAGVLALDPENQGPEPSLQEKAGVGIEGGAEVELEMLDLADELLRADDRAGHDVAMAVEVFGGAVEDEIETDLQGPEIDGCREGGVDEGEQAMAPGESHDGFEIGDLHQGIGDRLDVDHTGLGPYQLVPAFGVLGIECGRLDAQAGQVFVDEGLGAAIDVLVSQEVIAATDDGQYGSGDRCHARGRDESRFTGFDGREARVQGLVVG